MKENYKRVILVLLIAFFSDNLTAQDKTSVLISKINKIWIEQVKITNPQKIYYNRLDRTLDIDGYVIDLAELNVGYRFRTDQNTPYHLVSFSCREELSNCLINQNGKRASRVGFSFKSKEACYNFLDALSQLKDIQN